MLTRGILDHQYGANCKSDGAIQENEESIDLPDSNLIQSYEDDNSVNLMSLEASGQSVEPVIDRERGFIGTGVNTQGAPKRMVDILSREL